MNGAPKPNPRLMYVCQVATAAGKSAYRVEQATHGKLGAYHVKAPANGVLLPFMRSGHTEFFDPAVAGVPALACPDVVNAIGKAAAGLGTACAAVCGDPACHPGVAVC